VLPRSFEEIADHEKWTNVDRVLVLMGFVAETVPEWQGKLANYAEQVVRGEKQKPPTH
jgi:hypothetical protein